MGIVCFAAWSLRQHCPMTKKPRRVFFLYPARYMGPLSIVCISIILSPLSASVPSAVNLSCRGWKSPFFLNALGLVLNSALNPTVKACWLPYPADRAMSMTGRSVNTSCLAASVSRRLWI